MTSPRGSNRSICTALTIAHIRLKRKATMGPVTFPASNVPSFPST